MCMHMHTSKCVRVSVSTDDQRIELVIESSPKAHDNEINGEFVRFDHEQYNKRADIISLHTMTLTGVNQCSSHSDSAKYRNG